MHLPITGDDRPHAHLLLSLLQFGRDGQLAKANSDSVFSPLIAARATFALDPGRCVRRVRLVICAPEPRHFRRCQQEIQLSSCRNFPSHVYAGYYLSGPQRRVSQLLCKAVPQQQLPLRHGRRIKRWHRHHYLTTGPIRPRRPARLSEYSAGGRLHHARHRPLGLPLSPRNLSHRPIRPWPARLVPFDTAEYNRLRASNLPGAQPADPDATASWG